MNELRIAEDWGFFKFVPQESLDPEVESWGWVPDIDPIEDPEAWQPMDLLVAPLYGPNGELRGTLSIDCPTAGSSTGTPSRRPERSTSPSSARRSRSRCGCSRRPAKWSATPRASATSA